MKARLIVATAALALTSGAVIAVAGPDMNGCDRSEGGSGMQQGVEKGGMHSGMQGGRYEKGQHNPEQKLQRLEQELSLNDMQRQQMAELLQQRSGQMAAKHTQMQQFRSQMQGLSPAAADYQDQVEKIAKQKAEVMSKQMVEGAKLHVQVYALLTPEQQQLFSKMEQRRGERHGRGESRGQHHRGG